MAIFRSAVIIAFFTAISRIMGFVRDLLIAKFLGVSVLSDVFFAAFRLPNLFRRIFAEGAFNSAFVPLFVEKMQAENGKEEALIFVRNIFSLLLYCLLIMILIMQIFMPFVMMIIFPGFTGDEEKFMLVTSLSRITIFYLLFISLVSLFSGMLNSIGKFAAPSATPIILNGTLIFSLFAFANHTPNLAYALSWGVFIAGILQFLWLGFFLYKEKMFLYPNMPKITDDTKKFFKKLLPGIIGANVMQINLLVGTLFASLIPGAVSYLYYSDRINQLPLALIGIAIGVALLPALSQKIKSKNEKEAIELQNTALEISLILAIPAALALALLAYPIIFSLFQRGEFGPEETIAVAKALKFYAIGLPAFIMVKIFEPGYFARGDTKTPMKIAIKCLIINAALNAILFFPFGYIGIVIASVISSYINVTLLYFGLVKQEHFFFTEGLEKRLLKILICAIAMVLVTNYMDFYFHYSDKLHPITELLIMVTSGLATFLIAAYIFGSLKILAKNLRKV